ncbi:MAG: thioredoxin domain-containing protein [Actinobacteria bacterium]|nr:thioredoxin domain-containing protein [Actinomycetota bacterium]
MTARANRLIDETSPYLLQHAHNPVDWYPWGEEAKDRARQEDKPILLSIGYAACHWCHVMERESFENEETARKMNAEFICIKVDREERPDIDTIYMDAVQSMTGHGGWPMTVFLTPDGSPFYGGTYFPPDDRHGLPGFPRVLDAVAGAWRDRRNEVEEQGRELVARIQALTRPAPSQESLTAAPLASAVTTIGNNYDATFGGFGGAPKFPQAPVLEFMLRAGSTDDEAAQMVRHTLDQMARGGIYDQLGGGFHRYSVDQAWLVPHFEKMLYDNAQLARVFTRAWQLWGDPEHRRIAEETLEYLLRDMRDRSGGFYSSEDADSEGEEGKFYVWSFEEFSSVAPEAADYYGVSEAGNFEGTNILTATEDPPPTEARQRLLELRQKRIRPGRDEKILTSWNGLVISAMAEAGAAFSREDYIAEAKACAKFLLDSARIDDRMMHSFKDGQARVLGLLEDYAYLAEGLLTLWEATLEPQWYQAASEIASKMIELFWDETNGGFFATGNDHEELIVRPKEIIESATPSPNGIATLVLQKLGIISGDDNLRSHAEQTLRLARIYLERVPQATPTFLAALDFELSTPKEIVIVSANDPAGSELFKTVWGRLIPNRVLAGSPPGIASPMLEGKEPMGGQATAFLCANYVCQAPTTDPKELLRQLGLQPSDGAMSL